MKFSLPRPGVGVASLTSSVILACGLSSNSDDDSTLNGAFYGYSASLSDAVMELQVQAGGQSYTWTGAPTATETNPQGFSELTLRSGETVVATAVLRTAQGLELARATTQLSVQARYLYGFGFQAGGRNPDTRGFCHQRPVPVPVSGFPGDSLFLWKSGLPVGAVC